MSSINDQLRELYDHCSLQDFFLDASVLILKEDGQVISELGKKIDQNILHQSGVLMTGAWQASLAMKVCDKQDSDQILSLGSTQSGFYVLPFTYDQSLVMGIIYKDHVNPGKLKMKAKTLRDFLSENLTKTESLENKTNDNYLFKNITDAELDKLFSFAGI